METNIPSMDFMPDRDLAAATKTLFGKDNVRIDLDGDLRVTIRDGDHFAAALDHACAFAQKAGGGYETAIPEMKQAADRARRGGGSFPVVVEGWSIFAGARRAARKAGLLPKLTNG